MKTEFKADVTVKEMFTFLINTTYRKFTGVLWILFSIVVIVVTIYTWGDVSIPNSLLLILIALLYTVINPVMLYFKAKRQIKNNAYFIEGCTYTVDEKGIAVSMNGESESTKWDEMWKAVKYGSEVVIYVTNIRAFIIPIRCMGDDYNTFVKIAAKGLGSRCHLGVKNI